MAAGSTRVSPSGVLRHAKGSKPDHDTADLIQVGKYCRSRPLDAPMFVKRL